jgi:hypothetical protein
MRLIESVSEGASYKLRGPTADLVERFKERQRIDEAFADIDDVHEFERIAADII